MNSMYHEKLVHTFEPYEGYCLVLSFPNSETELKAEFNTQPSIHILWQRERLFLVEGLIRPCLWAQNHWLHPSRWRFESIKQAKTYLQSQAPRWSLHSTSKHRRAHLIQEQLRSPRSSILKFGQPLQTQIHGEWTLEDEHHLWQSTKQSHPLPLGDTHFEPDEVNPPSRAYLKLWEAFTLLPIAPQSGQKVIDAGSSPGGWTWVLQSLGCEVISVDKAPLHQNLTRNPRITSIKKDAFTLPPEALGVVDYFFSDIICYPEKLLSLVQKWLDSGFCENFVCTIKFKGACDYSILNQFVEIPNSRLIHLCANKNEVTWIRHSGLWSDPPTPSGTAERVETLKTAL